MAIRFRCDSCRQLLSIASRKAGAEVNCPACGARLRVPVPDETEPTSPPDRATTGAVAESDPSAAEAEHPPASDAQGPLPSEAVAASAPDEVPDEVPVETAAGPPDADHDQEPPQLVLRRPETDFEEMDLTPMVDVTFLLLIFFMITASFSVQKSIDMPAPDPDKQGATQSLQTLDDFKEFAIIVEIDADNVIYIDDERLNDRSRLVETLRDRKLLEEKTELVLEADAQALHDTVVAVLDAANAVGMQKIRLATRKTDGG